MYGIVTNAKGQTATLCHDFIWRGDLPRRDMALLAEQFRPDDFPDRLDWWNALIPAAAEAIGGTGEVTAPPVRKRRGPLY